VVTELDWPKNRKIYNTLIEPHSLNMLVDRGESQDDVIQADQVLRGNRIPGQLGIFVVIGGDAGINNNGGLKRIHPSTGLRAASFPRGRKRYDLKTSTDRGRKLISPRH
jgi:hypothetical protein